MEKEHSDYKILTAPEVVSTSSQSVIRCLYENIQIEHIIYPCPSYPFKLDPYVDFRIGNTTHEATFVRLSIPSYKLPYQIARFRPEHGESPDYAPLLKNLAERNRNSVTAREFGLQKETITAPFNAFTLTRIIFLVMVFFACGCGCLYVCQKSDRFVCISPPGQLQAQPQIFVQPQAPTAPAPDGQFQAQIEAFAQAKLEKAEIRALARAQANIQPNIYAELL